MEEGVGSREGGGRDLLVTITIKLLYKTPVDNIGGITEQERQSSFIKKSLAGGEGRQRLHPGWVALSELSLWGGSGCRVWALQPLWVLLIYAFIFCTCPVQTWEPTRDSTWICMQANWCVLKLCVWSAPFHMSERVILCFRRSFPALNCPFIYLIFFLFLFAFFCFKAGANFASIDPIIFIGAFVAAQFVAPCFFQLSSKQMWLWGINANVQLH